MDLTRNIGIMTQKQFELIQTKRIAILGVGMGSVIAEAALRLGFQNFLLIDGDHVSKSNLNRQNFTDADVGNLKTQKILKRLKQINPLANIAVYNKYLMLEDIEEKLSNVDIIIDTIDISNVDIILGVHNFAQKNKLPIIFPLNLGWSSIVIVFDKNSCSIGEVLKLTDEDCSKAKHRDFSFWADFLSQFVPKYAQKEFRAFVDKSSKLQDWCPAPQIGPTIMMTSSIVSHILYKLVTGAPVKIAPEVTTVDLNLETLPLSLKDL